MADLTKEEFEQMYRQFRAKEEARRKEIDVLDLERKTLKESVKKGIASLS